MVILKKGKCKIYGVIVVILVVASIISFNENIVLGNQNKTNIDNRKKEIESKIEESKENINQIDEAHYEKFYINLLENK